MWMAIAFFCAAYVFMGIIPAVYFLDTGQWILGALSVIAYILNLALLSHAKKKPW